jgi:hypothetical protein
MNIGRLANLRIFVNMFSNTRGKFTKICSTKGKCSGMLRDWGLLALLQALLDAAA